MKYIIRGITTMITRRQLLHLLLIALIVLLLILYGVLHKHFKEMSNLTFNAFPIMVLNTMFPAILGVALFTRYFVSTKCNYKRPYLVWVCVLVVMSIVVVLADWYYWMQNAFFYSIIVWTEALCEFFTLRRKASDS